MVERNTVFDYLNAFLMILLLGTFAFPLLYVVFLSVSDTFKIANGTFQFWPVGFQLSGYAAVFKNSMIWRGFANSFMYSAAGTVLTLILCSLPGYVLSSNDFKAKRTFTVFFAITMFFNGGIIPTFLVVSKLGLLDTIWPIIIFPSLSCWNIILFRTNFKQIPDALLESAKIDGASHFWIYAKLVVGLSKPIFAVVSIFAFVQIWNQYFPALLYLTSQDKQPLMIVMRKYVVDGNMRGLMENITTQMGKTIEPDGFARSVKMSAIIVSIFPILGLYPFMQRFMGKGIMIGSLKG